MAQLATLLSNTFQTPVPTAQGGTEEQGFQGIGSPAEGLQAVEGLTKEYYQKWADIESFANEMNQMGIDVTKPDWRSKEAMEAHQIYKKAMADMQYQGQRMQNSQKMLEQFTRAKLSAHGADIQYGGDLNQILDPALIENTGMTDVEKTEATDARAAATQEALDTRAAVSNEAADVRTDKTLAARAREGSLNRAVQLEIAKLRDKTARGKIEQKVAPYAGLHEEILNITSGKGDYSVSTETNDSGTPMLESDAWAGKRLGSYEQVKVDPKTGNQTVKTLPKIVKGTLRDPDTGEIFILFENGDRQSASPNDAESLLRSYAESNQGYKGTDVNTYLETLDQLPTIEQVALDESLVGATKQVKAKADKDLKLLEGINRGGSNVAFTLPDGGEIVMHRESKHWSGIGKSYIQIDNGEQYGVSPDTQYTEAEAIKILHDLGYYSKKGTNVALPKAPTSEVVPIDTSASDAGTILNVPK